jgi:hypothetical protein
MKRVQLMNKIISVGNPNRLVKVARDKYRRDDFFNYSFDLITGEIIEVNSSLKSDTNIYALTDSRYPVFKSQQYIGYVLNEKFISPDGVQQGYVDTTQERKIRKNREALRELLCSRFR